MRKAFYVTVSALFKNKSTPIKYDKVTKIHYSTENKEVTLEGEDIINHEYPLEANYKIYGDNVNAIIYSSDLRSLSFERDHRIYH